MRRVTGVLSFLIVVGLCIAADRPDQAAKKVSSQVKVKVQATAGSPAAAVEGRPKPTGSNDPRATSLFRSAQNLEKSGKTTGVVALYRDVLIRYPESPEAPEAAARLKVLGGKIPGPNEIKPAPPAEEARFTRAPKPKYASQRANRDALNQALGGMVGGATSQPATSGPTRGYGK